MRRLRTTLIAVTLTGATLGGGLVAAASSSDENPGVSHQAAMPAGAQFITALAERDFAAAGDLIAPDIEFKALTPSQGFVDLKGSEAVMTLMREWYGTAEALERIETDKILKRHHVGYRIRWADPANGDMVFEQHAFYDLDGTGRINRLHLVCTGDQPIDS